MKQTITSLLLLGIFLFFAGAIKAQVVDPPALNVYTTTGPITIDGNLNEPDWSKPMPALKFRINGTPSGNYSTPTAFAVVKEPYHDTSTCYVKFLRNGMDLYVSLQSDDKQVCKFDWEGDGMFLVLKNGENNNSEFKFYVINPTTFGVETGGAAAPSDGYASAAIVNGTIYDSAHVDNGYTAELVIHLDKIKYTTAPASIQLFLNIFDPDDYSTPGEPWGAHGNYAKQWWGSEWGSELRTLNLLNQVLPVELTSFAAVSVKEGVKLNWATATETNNRGFEVQRSNDKSNFVTVAFVQGKGTSVEQNTYSYLDKNVNPGTYYYRLKQIDMNGTFSYSNVAEINAVHNLKYELVQNYPNPFNPSTTIRYSVPDNNFVSIKVFDVLGNEVATLVNEQIEAGQHAVTFNAASLSSGVYYYTIKSGSFADTKKFILMK